VTSVELVPPKSSDMTALLDRARKCAEAGVDAINIPTAPGERPGLPHDLRLTILQQVGIEPILHYCCRDRNLIGMQSDLLGDMPRSSPTSSSSPGTPRSWESTPT